jgi:cell division septal protein FtsQ
MWFNRQPKNRRFKRGHVLDVKLRSSQVRATRMRYGAVALALLCGTAIGLYALWLAGHWTLNRLVYENRAFAIQQILVHTDGVISPDQLRRWAGVKTGENIFALDLQRVKRDLEMVPLISFVSVERILPRTLRLRVSEREPVAQVSVLRNSGQDAVVVSTFHLDPDGFVMLPLDPRQRVRPLGQAAEPLPVLTGVGLHELQPGRRLDSPQVQAAMRLITEFAHSPMAGMVDLKSIYTGSPEVLVVTTGQGSEITFGLNDLDRQMRRWREIHDLGQRLNKSLATLDLAVSNNIPASWHQAGVTPGTAPKAPKTLRPKRKNV